MTRTRTALAAVAVAALALTACGADVNTGEVTDRYYKSGYTYWTSTLVCGKTCTSVPITQYQPERYVLTLTNCDLPHDRGEACPSERHNVDPATYANTQLGDTITLGD